MGKKIVVGLSGGVDSSVALLLLKRQGWQPIGVSLRFPAWESTCNAARENACCTEQALSNARCVCERLGVPYHIYDVRKKFERKVMGYFISELSRSRTPNPCLICNRELKIKELFAWAKRHGISKVATGHYAKIVFEGQPNGMAGEKAGSDANPSSGNPSKPAGIPSLLRSDDRRKDQSYGLCLLPPAFLSNLVLPLGNLTKEQVYEIAIKEGFGFFKGVRQSQDLCFVSGAAMRQFILEKVGKKEGPILDDNGNRIGTHPGLHFYTIGQRRGIGLPFLYYVKGMDRKRNALLVTRNRSRVLGNGMLAEKFNWLVSPVPKRSFRAAAQIRSSQPEVPVEVLPDGKKLKIKCLAPAEGITPGQICALYKRKVCLGGGAIERALCFSPAIQAAKQVRG